MAEKQQAEPEVGAESSRSAESPPVAAEGAPSPEATSVPGSARAASPDMGLVYDVPLRLSVEVGSTRLKVRDVLQLAEGSIVELDRLADEPADLFVNGRLVGRGDVTVVDDRLAVKLVELVGESGDRREGS